MGDAIFEVEIKSSLVEGRKVHWAIVTCPHGERLTLNLSDDGGPDFRSKDPPMNVWKLVDIGGGRCEFSPSILWSGGSGQHRDNECHFGPGTGALRWVESIFPHSVDQG